MRKTEYLTPDKQALALSPASQTMTAASESAQVVTSFALMLFVQVCSSDYSLQQSLLWRNNNDIISVEMITHAVWSLSLQMR
jgi:hypothetical protein